MVLLIKQRVINIILSGVVAVGYISTAALTALVSENANATVAHADEWKKSNGGWWYQAGKSYAKGWKKISGTWYYFDSKGWMKSGWQKISGEWYYFSKSGAMQTGWQRISGNWYYLKSSGAMATDWNKVGSTWYYHTLSGAMITGWQFIGRKWYYFHNNGAMAANEWVGNYYLKSDGSMATNQWIGIYYVNANGLWDATRDSSQALRITTDWYEFDLPTYWKDKVSYSRVGSKVQVSLAGRNDCSLFYINAIPTPSRIDGDMSNPKIFSAENAQGVSIELWMTNWVCLAAVDMLYGNENSLIECKNITQRNALLAELINLETGGSVTLDRIKENPKAFLYSTAAINYITNEIASTIVVKDAVAP